MELTNLSGMAARAVPFDNVPGSESGLVVIVKGTFRAVPGGSSELASEQGPVSSEIEMMDGEAAASVKFESDVVPFKPRADIALVGKVYAPGGRPVTELDAGLRVGSVSRALRVFGDRFWECASPLLPATISAPRPFVTMPLCYERAFGGIDPAGGGYCRENPVGRGFLSEKSKKQADGALLPNIEDPRRLIRSFTDHPGPAGLGFIGRGFMPRFGHIGTYDEKWKQARRPRMPVDFRFDFFNASPPDLQVDGYLRGDEEVALANLTPDGKLQFRLPGIAPSVSVTTTDRFEVSFSHPATEASHDLPMRLDTLCLMPDEKRFTLVWRGIFPTRSLDLLEVKSVEIGMKQVQG